MSERFKIVGDDSGHEYCIPVARTADWEAFMALDADDPASWDAPDWAERVEGYLTFTDPKFDGT